MKIEDVLESRIYRTSNNYEMIDAIKRLIDYTYHGSFNNDYENDPLKKLHDFNRYKKYIYYIKRIIEERYQNKNDITNRLHNIFNNTSNDKTYYHVVSDKILKQHSFDF